MIASNTSGLPIEELGAASGRSSQVLGLHFFNPVPAMRLVEVVRAPETTDATVARGVEFARAVGKETVEVRDMPGFVTTRLGTLLMCEAIRAYEQGVASAEHLDTAMKLGYNHPMGPLELADRVGLDTVLSVLDDLTRCTATRSPPRRCCARWWPRASWAGRAEPASTTTEPPDDVVGGERHREREGGAPSGFALDPDPATVQLGEALRDRQADAGAAGVVAVARLVEAVEDPLLLVGGDAGAFVGDRDDDLSLGAAGPTTTRLPAGENFTAFVNRLTSTWSNASASASTTSPSGTSTSRR